ncbi:uncharacterized protein HD556DRAFT_1308606 [Suillus plorans]|uniref:Uncharacterized protein n=1 Tax=Suillus plorans TaxID=116603 RepID=A0A9P7DHZ7_9AGAM|nr:uncharacterized protein HD556DRAFT_1308606 [Suillus plorans]KAG1793468.1 hypothetical protein HD556DRAFT_1308606 [Suillus plorans]
MYQPCAKMVSLKSHGQRIHPAQYATALASDRTAKTYYQLEPAVNLMRLPGGKLVDNTNESGEEIASVKVANTINDSQSPPKTSKANFDDSGPSVQNDEAPPLAVREYENGEVDSMVKLKERLQLAEKNCSRLEELRQKYRLRWLEENYRARVLEEYAPNGINTCPPHQIAWDAPSPVQSEYNLEVEDERIGGCGNTGGLFRSLGQVPGWYFQLV